MAPPSTAPAAALFLAALLVLSASPAAAARLRSSSKANGKHGVPAASTTSAAGPHDIPAVFAFGDSTLDPGNNNRLVTVVRADHAPYGRAFPAGVPPSGRFSDGKLITDYIVAALGIKDLLPAYHASGVTHANATTGVSFASGGSGLDDLTAHTVQVSTFSSQIADFQQLMSRIGEPQAADVAAKSLFILSAGTNDVTMNYFDLPFRALEYPTIDEYHDYLISRYQSYIQSLYKLGARRFIVAGMPPVGCLPMQKSLRGLQPPLGHGCVDRQNEETQRYNAKLQKALAALEKESPGASLSYVDTYAPLMDMVAQPSKYGFTHTGQGCCGFGLLEMGVMCTDLLPQCDSPAQYMFFDAVHPTQAAYRAVADQIIKTHVSQFTTN
ncbi:GDSL esterase/lipase At2g40250-like [Hordeum vulgare subsp. vulgare]|uniref:GDSL esterase/lipase n=1 Tax=Hordeum vulgare subsp. vulgare TaxID=112509 RepID=A0A8I6W767_HORVV|nr:GDSL esterase/lipase At2g40250-like [Hordeum vulgare subsp. vulgare]